MSTSARVARAAASDRALPASVPPTPPTSTRSAPSASTLGGQSIGHRGRQAVRADRHAAGERLAEGDEVGPQAPGLGAARRGRPRACGSRRSAAACPCGRTRSRSPSRKPGSGRTMPMLVRAGSVMTHGDLLVGQGRLHGREVVPLDGPGGGRRIHRGTDVPGSRRPCGRRGRAPRRSRRRCRGSCRRSTPRAGRPVTRRARRSAQRLASVAERAKDQRGSPKRARQLAGHPRRVLGGEHGRDAAEVLHSVSHGRHGGRRRVTRHRTRVAEREVDVGVAVEVGDAAARGLGEEDREAAGPLGHPRHRHAADQVGGGGGRRGGRPGASGGEGGALAVQQLLQP